MRIALPVTAGRYFGQQGGKRMLGTYWSLEVTTTSVGHALCVLVCYLCITVQRRRAMVPRRCEGVV